VVQARGGELADEEWPMFVLTICEEKSMSLRPSPSHRWEPSALTTVMGVIFCWALHEWNTCSRSTR